MGEITSERVVELQGQVARIAEPIGAHKILKGSSAALLAIVSTVSFCHAQLQRWLETALNGGMARRIIFVREGSKTLSGVDVAGAS